MFNLIFKSIMKLKLQLYINYFSQLIHDFENILKYRKVKYRKHNK
jgi:hypothetical protein